MSSVSHVSVSPGPSQPCGGVPVKSRRSLMASRTAARWSARRCIAPCLTPWPMNSQPASSIARATGSYEPVARAMLDAGWEFMGHGVKQGAMHLLADQRAAVREAIKLLRDFTGTPPQGWLGPGLTETWETLDILAEEGIAYVSDWVNDDQPYEIRTTAGTLVSVPYTLELNDIPMMVIQHHESSYWQERVRDQFDRLYLEGARNPRVMAIAVHPYIHGVPHRIKYFEAAYDYIRKHRGVWLTTGEEIYEWYKRTAQSSEPPPRRVARAEPALERRPLRRARE